MRHDKSRTYTVRATGLYADVRVSGRFYRQTLTDPAEDPEVEILSACDDQGNDVVLADKQREDVETRALELDQERS